MEAGDMEELWSGESFSWCGSEVLREGMGYAVSGGKRIRPLLCIKLCDALDGDTGKAEVFGRAVESMHNATLVHDDIQDGDEYRRGRESVWRRYGKPQAINIGEALFANGYRHLLEKREMFDPEEWTSLMEVYNQAEVQVLEGQARDIEMRDSDRVTEEDYMEMVEKKTGALLVAALQGAGLIAGRGERFLEELKGVGRLLGPAFQIRDDVIDLVGEKGRENLGNDVREGKRSMVVVKAVQSLEPPERTTLFDILDAEREATTSEDVDRAIHILESVSAVQEANGVAEKMAREAQDRLRHIGEEGDLGEVEDIIDYMVERKF